MTAPATPATLAMPRTAAAQSALVQKVDAYCRAGFDDMEAVNMAARELAAKSQGGDIFWALAHVSAVRKNALQLDRAPTRDEAFEAQLSFGS